MFEPYIIRLGYGDLDFFIATPQAQDWYDPPKDYVLMEYEWIVENIPIKGKNVIDGGSHHGHYSVVLRSQRPNHLMMVEPHPSNQDICEVNVCLNGNDDRWGIMHGALWNETGKIHYDGNPNGALSLSGQGIEVDALRLQDVDPKAQVVKLDIEGAEYAVIPEALETMHVESWIIEMHSGHDVKEAQDMTSRMLAKAGYELHWVNREKMRVEPYALGTVWPGHSTLFARR